MMRRYKQNRELMNRNRDRAKDAKKRYVGKRTSANSEITPEKREQINKNIKERELSEQRYGTKKMLLILSVLMAIALLGLLIFKIFLNQSF